MATVGTRLTIPFTVGTSQIVGQGNTPELWCLYTTDDASSTSPTWNTVPWTDVRSFSISRGRENELSEVDAGTATITLDNRDRNFDPSFNTAIRPLNRWWLREQFSGETQDLFYGYAEAYEQSWPGTGVGNAETVVSCADEFKVLALDKLPTMSPPRDTYEDYVQIDAPLTYWTFNDPSLSPIVGQGNLASAPGYTVDNDTPVTGGRIGPFAGGGSGSLKLTSGQALTTDGTSAIGDYIGMGLFTLETWFKSSTSGSSGSTVLIQSPLDTTIPSTPFRLLHNVGGTIAIEVTNNSGTVYTATSTTVLTANVWYHLVGVWDVTAGTLKLYVNGVNEATTAQTGTTSQPDDPATFNVGNSSATYTRWFGHLAFYRQIALSASRILSHYQSGSQRGFPAGQLPGARIGAVLDSATSAAPRNLSVGVRPLQGVFMTGQPPLDELRRAKTGDNVDSLLFVSRNGTVTFLDATHRDTSPYNTVQAVFGDGRGGTTFTLNTSTLNGTDTLGTTGTELPYSDVKTDFTESFLANIWNVTKDGGVTQNATDSASTSRYFDRPQSITDLPVISDSDASSVASSLLAKYQDPLERVTSIALDTSIPDVAAVALARDIGDRVEVVFTPPPGGGRLDQVAFIQKIQIDGDNSLVPWRIQWAVSPL